jgi:hypothetical protein
VHECLSVPYRKDALGDGAREEVRLNMPSIKGVNAVSKLSAPLIYLSKTGNYISERMALWLRKK